MFLLRRKLAPYTRGSIGATGEVRRKVEFSWAMMGAFAAGLGFVLFFRDLLGYS